MISKRLEARVRRDFAFDSSEAVLEDLASMRLALAETQSLERIQAAVVLLADGDRARFDRAVAIAERDWRDVLVAAGLANGDSPAGLDVELGRPACP